MKKNKVLFGVCLIIFISMCSCTKSATNKNEELIELNQFFSRYQRYVESGNLDSLMMLWDDNAKRITPGEPTIVGKDNIRASFKFLLESFDIQMIPYGEMEADVCNDIAYGHYNVSIVMTPKEGGEPQYTDLKGLTVFKKNKDGQWKTLMDCMNFHPTIPSDSIDSRIMSEPSIYY
jgi:ketosteroid isomerase-like protein